MGPPTVTFDLNYLALDLNTAGWLTLAGYIPPDSGLFAVSCLAVRSHRCLAPTPPAKIQAMESHGTSQCGGVAIRISNTTMATQWAGLLQRCHGVDWSVFVFMLL